MSFDRTTVAYVLGLFVNGLAAVRSLGRLGIPVRGLGSSPDEPGFKSRYCHARVCPDPVNDPEELARLLVEEGRGLAHPAVLIPCTDAYVLFLSRFRGELSRYYRFALPSAEVIEALVNKRKLCELAEQVGTAYPRTVYPETVQDAQRLKREVDYPAFVKPYYSHLWRQHFGGAHKGFRVSTPDELVDRFQLAHASGHPVLAQSFALGPDSNLVSVDLYISQQDEPLATHTRRQIRQYPPGSGVVTLGLSERFPDVADQAVSFCQKIGYRGLAGLEWKIDERDGQAKLLDFNPRLMLSSGLATACGVNAALLLYLDLTGQRPRPITHQAVGMKWLDLRSDYLSLVDRYRRDEITIADWLRSWWGVRSFATFALDDLGPILYTTRYGTRALRLPALIVRQLRGRSRGGSGAS